ncbi:hypothetical protein JEM67_26220 [Serratia sp. PAMC26656]|uniref:MrpH family fimbial adhesin n=1 Tax=Serratia sp. PAMC26656 TaxID=2775909 RepID=UPI0018F44D5C|nr:hypothetical protein [Serratia sp. PAMC26656]MBJ7893503.1 hypothetical protein [Serratia sp. PAMC26656]
MSFIRLNKSNVFLLVFLAMFSCIPLKAVAGWEVEYANWNPTTQVMYVNVGRPDMTSGERNPCLSANKSCSIRVIVNQYRNGRYVNTHIIRYWTWGYGGAFPWADLMNLATVGDLERYLNDRVNLPQLYYASNIWGMQATDTAEACIAYNLGSGDNTSTKIWPGSICKIATPPGVTCDIEPAQINLNHGEVIISSVNQNVATATAYAKCSSSMSLKIRAVSGGRVDLGRGGSLVSILSIGGVQGGGGNIVATPAGTPVEIKSTLQQSGAIAEGPYSGSDIISFSVN